MTLHCRMIWKCHHQLDILILILLLLHSCHCYIFSAIFTLGTVREQAFWLSCIVCVNISWGQSKEQYRMRFHYVCLGFMEKFEKSMLTLLICLEKSMWSNTLGSNTRDWIRGKFTAWLILVATSKTKNETDEVLICEFIKTGQAYFCELLYLLLALPRQKQM